MGHVIWPDIFYSFIRLGRWGCNRCSMGSMIHIGIDEDFIKSIRSKVTEGTSALFLMTSDAVEDKVVKAMKQTKFELIASNLSKEEERKIIQYIADNSKCTINNI